MCQKLERTNNGNNKNPFSFTAEFQSHFRDPGQEWDLGKQIMTESLPSSLTALDW
jgi:hypothetical protein